MLLSPLRVSVERSPGKKVENINHPSIIKINKYSAVNKTTSQVHEGQQPILKHDDSKNSQSNFKRMETQSLENSERKQTEKMDQLRFFKLEEER